MPTAARPIKLDSPLGDGALLFRRMTATEALGRPFEYELELLSEDEVDFASVIGKPMTVEIEQGGGGERYFNGIVVRFGYAGRGKNYRSYRASLRPQLWLLKRRSNCRIFQNKSAPDIIKALFQEHGLSFRASLNATYATHEYKVQYRESDFDFVSRLMEEEGIYYFFEHAADRHTLVMADSYGAHEKVPGYETIPFKEQHERAGAMVEHVAAFSVAQQIESGSYLHEDFDFTRPKASLLTKRISRADGADSHLEVYDYPGAYTQSADGEAFARVRLEEIEAEQLVAEGEGDARALGAGVLFTLSDSPRDADNKEYLVVGMRAELREPLLVSESERERALRKDEPFESFRCSFTAIDAHRPFRTARTTPRPIVRGPQTAMVVGKEGEEIWTDEYGRVKLLFHWDREGKQKNDGNSSCWVRVAQVWAGGKWGAIFTPRIGQEVVVDFLEGDPDRPMVTGRLYNGENKPPYDLPANQTQSGFKTHSSKGGTDDNFNELRFEDKKGEELVHMQAEKDHSVLVKNDETIEIDHDRKKTVKNDETTEVMGNRTETVDKDETITIKGNRTEEVDKDETITVKGNRTETVDKDETITVKGNRTEEVDKDETITVKGKRTETVDKDEAVTVQGKQSVSVTKDQTVSVQGKRTITVTQDNELSATGKVTISSTSQIELKCGAGSITIKPSGEITINGVQLAIKGVQLALEGSAKLEAKGAVASVEGQAKLDLKAGGMLTLSAPMISGG